MHTISGAKPRGGYRVGSGRKSAFPGKVKAVYMDFTPTGHRVLARLVKRTKLSRNDVIGHLTLTHAVDLDFTGEGVAYPGKRHSNVMAIRLNAEADELLRAVCQRTGKSRSDVGEALVRRCTAVAGFPSPPRKHTHVKA